MTDVGHFLASKEKGLQKLKDYYPDIWNDSLPRRHNSRYWMMGIAAVFMTGLSLIFFL